MELRFFLLETVNATPSPQWIYFRIATVLAIFFAGSALSPLAARFVPAPVRAIVTWPAWFYAATILLIAWLRYPGLLSPHLNPDEAQFTAAAAKLLLDPIFWRSVDTGTSGPFNIYPLTLPHLLGWSPDYASSRVIALLMLSGSVLLLHRALTWTYTDSSARVALMPLVFSIALLQDSDYVHYSSEHGPLLLLSTALFFICRISAPSQSEARWLSFATGLALGSIPYAKM